MFNFHRLNSEIVIHEIDPPPISSDLLELVSDLREEKKMTNGKLFNELILSFHQRKGAKFSGWFVEYGWWIAQMQDSTLFEKLKIRPFAVSGLIQLSEGVVFGCRSLDMTQDPGFWELPPSGGIGTECLRPNNIIFSEHQIAIELEEELNISYNFVQSLVPFGFFEDETNHVCDIAYDIFLDMSPEDLMSQFEKSHNSEYTELRIISIQELTHFIWEDKNKISPLSIELLKLRGIVQC